MLPYTPSPSPRPTPGDLSQDRSGARPGDMGRRPQPPMPE